MIHQAMAHGPKTKGRKRADGAAWATTVKPVLAHAASSANRNEESMGQGDVTIHITGNLTANPELRFTSSGAAVTSFTVVTSPRKFNRDTQAWEDGDPTFWNCTVWRDQAERVAEFSKGDRVMVEGTIAQQSYETREGEKRTTMKVTANEVGLSAKFHPVQANRPERSGGQQQAQRRPQQPPDDDPWGLAPPSYTGRAATHQGGFNDEPPF